MRLLDPEDLPILPDDSLYSTSSAGYLMTYENFRQEKIAMKRNLTLPFATFTVACSMLIVGCSIPAKTTQAQVQPTHTPTPNEPSWKIVSQFSVDSRTHFVGFHQTNFGIKVGYGGAVSTTRDGGDTWTKANNDSWCRFGLDIVDENVAWHIGNGGHVGVSTDGGRNWQRATNLSDGGISKSIRFLDDQTGWAASEKELWATSNGGHTWVDVSLPEAGITILAIELLTEADGYLLVHPGTLFITHDGGITWASQDLGLGEEQLSFLSLPSMRFFDTENGLFIAKVSKKGIVAFRTTDGGKTWEQESVLEDVDSSNPGFYLSKDGRTVTITAGSITVLRNNR